MCVNICVSCTFMQVGVSVCVLVLAYLHKYVCVLVLAYLHKCVCVLVLA